MKVYQIFESYPLFYQPYIPPVINALREEGLDVTIIAFNGGKVNTNDAVVLPGHKKRTIYAKFSRFLKNKYRNLNYVEIKTLKKKIDIVHLQHSFLFPRIINLINLPKENRPKIIITLRGGDTYVKPWIDDKWKFFYLNYGNKVDAFVVMSENHKNYLSRWGVPLNNIHVIPISFGKKFAIQSKIANKNELRLISVFRMCWEKNIADNLRFVRALKQKNIPVVYDLYGDGRDLGQLFYLRDLYNLNKEVNILGKISNEKLKKSLKKYDFILQLSHSEAFPTSVLEAQSYGVPAIVSNNGGLPEMISVGENGIIVDLDDFESSVNNVISVWNTQSTYAQMSQNAIDRIHQNYSLENEVKRLHNLYSTLK